jgi:hypothetical protein
LVLYVFEDSNLTVKQDKLKSRKGLVVSNRKKKEHIEKRQRVSSVAIDVVCTTGEDGVRWEEEAGLDEVGDVEGHLVNVGVVELFNVLEGADILLGHEVDGNSLTTKTSSTSNTAP